MLTFEATKTIVSDRQRDMKRIAKADRLGRLARRKRNMTFRHHRPEPNSD